MLSVLKLRMPDPTLRFKVKTSEIPPALAIRIAASVELTGDTFAVKFALLAPAATVTEAGTLTSELLLDSPIANPPFAAGVFTVTVQLSVPDPVIELLAQVNAVSPGTPVPLRPTTVELPVEELLTIESCPACPPAAVGSNSTLSVSVWPGDNVVGKPSPGIEKPVPVRDAALTVTGMVPVDERTRGCVVAEPTVTLPNVTLEALIPRMAVAAPSSTLKVCATPPALAVNMAACAKGTAEALAENCALVAPDGTVTEAGTDTALSLLVRLTARPPLAAAAFNVTVQASLPDPVMDPLTHVNSVSNGTPVPLSTTEVELPFDALLAMVSWPLAEPDAVGPNWRVIVTLALAPTVIGMALLSLIENDCPVRFKFEIATAADPLLVTVMTLLAVLPTATCPKLTVLDDTERVPAAELFLAKDPEHPLRTRPQVNVSSPIKLQLQVAHTSSERARNPYRRSYEIYRQGIRK